MSDWAPLMVGDLVLLRPLWLLGLLLLPLLWRLMPSAGADRGAWAQVVDARLLGFLTRGGEVKAARSPRPYLIAALALLLLGLSGPAWERQPLPLARSQAATVAVFDLSPSMGASDLKPDRLTRARYKLIDWLNARVDGQTGLVVFGGQAFAVAPLTSDTATLVNLAEVLDRSLMPAPGARADLGIAKAMDLLEGGGIDGGEIILFTDGINRAAAGMADELSQRGMRLSILAVGTATGAPVALPGGGFLKDNSGNIVLPRLNRERLQSLSSATGGRYVPVRNDPSDLALLAGDSNRDPGQSIADSRGDDEQRQSDYWIDRGPWLLLAALPLCALCFRRGWLLALVLVLTPTLTPVQSAYASDSAEGEAEASAPVEGFRWQDLWLRRDQQAHAAMQEEQYERAEALALDPARRGAAAAARERWQQAAEHFAGAEQDDADAAYNQGTALAKAGDYAEALEALHRALQIDPDHPDALANKRAIEEWLKQQQQQQDSEDGEQSDEQDQSQSEQQDQQQSGDSEDQQQSGEQNESSDSADVRSGEQDAEQQQGQNAQSGDQEQQDGEQQAQSEPDSEQSEEQEQAEQQSTSGEDGQEQSEQQQAAAAEAAAESEDGTEAQSATAQMLADDDLSAEQRQALEQWLQRVPDDPGGLLRRKFQLESQRRPAPEPDDEDDSQW